MGLLLTYVTAGIVIALAAVWGRKRYMSFVAQEPDDYAFGEEFDIRKVLNGPIACDGIIYGPTGRVTSRFVARFDASWDGNTGRMKEVFHYDSGNVQHREWILNLEDGGAIRADADDLVSTGHGQQSGNAVCLKYKIKLSDEAGGHVLDARDWMYLLPNGSVINRNQFRKFGFKVAELVATMRPLTDAEAMEKAA